MKKISDNKNIHNIGYVLLVHRIHNWEITYTSQPDWGPINSYCPKTAYLQTIIIPSILSTEADTEWRIVSELKKKLKMVIFVVYVLHMKNIAFLYLYMLFSTTSSENAVRSSNIL